MKRLISLFLVCALSTLIPCPSGADSKKTKIAQLQGERYESADMGQIVNIRPCYHAGTEPEAGKYHLEVSAPGYETDKKWIEAGAGEDGHIDIRSEKPWVAQAAAPTGKTFTNSLGMRFVLIPAGSFMMGSPAREPQRFDDERQHRVSISRAFYMQITEVTQGQWYEVMGDNPSHFKNCGDDCPVEKISWYDVQSFIRNLNQREGTKKYRLPTEAEWEYTCRAGTNTPFFFGECLSTDEANYDGNCPMPGCPKGRNREEPIPVANFPPNAWGLYGMHGNVWEWCQDWYGPYPLDSVTDPTGSPSGEKHVLRGGSWRCCAKCSRSANRGLGFPGCRNNYFGFRVARTF
jgi:formylglycine-generating enzyme required for sulfatase activity